MPWRADAANLFPAESSLLTLQGESAIQNDLPPTSLLDDPMIQVGLAPLAVAFGLAAFIRVIGGPERGPRLMGIAAIAGFLLAYALFEGVPMFPPPAAKQKLFYLVILGAAAGFALDMTGRPAGLQRSARMILPGLALLWLAWRQLAAGVALAELATLAALWGGGALALWRLERAETESGGLSAAVMLIVAALTVAGIASLGASLTLALLAVALAAAAGGVALWGYGIWLIKATRGPFGATTLFGGGGALLALAYILTLFTPQASRAALVVVLLVFFADLAAGRIRLGNALRSRMLGPVLFAALAAVPALAAIGVASVGAGP